jgi:hypothetical protein
MQAPPLAGQHEAGGHGVVVTFSERLLAEKKKQGSKKSSSLQPPHQPQREKKDVLDTKTKSDNTRPPSATL